MLTLSLMLTLAACSPSRNKAPFQATLTDSLLTSDAFSEPLEELEADIAWMLYGLEDAGIAPELLTDLRAYRSAGATCEEVAVFLFSEETAAQAALNTLQFYLDTQIQTNKDYRPAEVPKLEQALLERRDTTVLLLVATNYEAAYELLNS